MSPTAQLIALMESMGWTDLEYGYDCDGGGPHLYGIGFSYAPRSQERAPDLTLDLMASAEATLVDEHASSNPAKHQTWMYAYHLCRILGIDTGAAGAGHIVYPHGAFVLLRATKEQRLGAYLRTIGKWVDSSAP